MLDREQLFLTDVGTSTCEAESPSPAPTNKLLLLLLLLLPLHIYSKHVSQHVTNRAHVLKSLLDREQLFLTDVGKSTCEAAARANMGHEWRLVFGGSQLTASTIGGSPLIVLLYCYVILLHMTEAAV
jgi:hypothetical protein